MVALAWSFLIAVALFVAWIAIEERGRAAAEDGVADFARAAFLPAFIAACFLVPIGVIAALVVILRSIFRSLIGGIQ